MSDSLAFLLQSISCQDSETKCRELRATWKAAPCVFLPRAASSSGKRSAMFPCAHLHIKHGKHLVRKVSFNLLILIAVPNITECPLNKGKRVPNNRVAEIAELKYDVEANHHLVLTSLTHHFSRPLLLLKKTGSITFGEMLTGSNKRILGFGVMRLA